jgi:hypothetical protein
LGYIDVDPLDANKVVFYDQKDGSHYIPIEGEETAGHDGSLAELIVSQYSFPSTLCTVRDDVDEDEEIDIRTVFGGVELYVPANVNVKVKSRSVFGGVGNHTFNREYQNIPTLYIVASNVFGGVHVKN